MLGNFSSLIVQIITNGSIVSLSSPPYHLGFDALPSQCTAQQQVLGIQATHIKALISKRLPHNILPLV